MKRKATRIDHLRDQRPKSYVFITLINGQVYVLIYRYVWQSIQCPGGVIEGVKHIRKYIKEGDGEKVLVYGVSDKTLAVGRINQLTLQIASSATHKNIVTELTKIYNWLNGHSLECLKYSKLPINIYYALDHQIKLLGIQ